MKAFCQSSSCYHRPPHFSIFWSYYYFYQSIESSESRPRLIVVSIPYINDIWRIHKSLLILLRSPSFSLNFSITIIRRSLYLVIRLIGRTNHRFRRWLVCYPAASFIPPLDSTIFRIRHQVDNILTPHAKICCVLAQAYCPLSPLLCGVSLMLLMLLMLLLFCWCVVVCSWSVVVLLRWETHPLFRRRWGNNTSSNQCVYKSSWLQGLWLAEEANRPRALIKK